MIVADRKKIPEIRDMIQNHRPRAAGGLRHLRDRLPGRRRARGGHPRLGPAHGPEARSAAATWWSTSAPSSGSARTPSSTSWPRVSPSTTPSARWAAAPACRPWPSGSPRRPSIPGLNTQFMGILESQGVWTEKCAGCGNCRLGEFAGICPITRCAKRLLNGPCGGSRDGKCEVSADLDCAWQLIYDRAKALGILDRFDADRRRRTTGPPAWTAARARWSAKTSASPGWGRRPEAACVRGNDD